MARVPLILLLALGAPALAQEPPDPEEDTQATPVPLQAGEAGQGASPRDAEETVGVVRGMPAWSVLAMDLDGDFLTELAVVSHHPVLWERRGADGRFQVNVQDSPWGKDSGDRHGMTACDVDRDGDFEVVVGSGGARGAGGASAELWERGADGRWVNRGPELLGMTQGARMRGVNCVDVDGDGSVELYFPVVGGDRNDMLLRRQPDGSYTDVAPVLGLSAQADSLGAVWGDLNGDRRIDLVRISDSHAQVLLQGADGVFSPGPSQPTEGGVFDVTLFDGDSDGDLDLYLARSRPAFDAARDGYFQVASTGRKTNTAVYKLPKGCNNIAFRLQGTLDGGKVELITGEGPQTVVGRIKVAEPFTTPIEAEQGVVAWVDEERRLLHVEARQVRGEVFLGLTCKNMDELPRLKEADIDDVPDPDNADMFLRNDGAGALEPMPGFIAPLSNTLDVLAFDVDLDGDQDLFTVGSMDIATGANTPDALLQNNGQGSFSPSPLWRPLAAEPPVEGRLAVPLDLNDDKYLDLLIFNGHHHGLLAGQVVAWINPGGDNHWLEVQALDKSGARSTSATVTVIVPGLAPQVRGSNPSPDWRSNGQGSSRFGLGQATRAKVIVTWPDGSKVVKRRVKADTTVLVEQR